MTPDQLALDAAAALAAGSRMSLIRRPGMKMPPRFPRGELLCENHNGLHVYSYGPARVLAWLNAEGLVSVTIGEGARG